MDRTTMRAMFLFGAAYASKTNREKLQGKCLDTLFPVKAVADAAAEMLSGAKTNDSAFDRLMKAMGLMIQAGSCVDTLIDTLEQEKSDRDLLAAVNRLRIAKKIGNATVEARYRAEVETMLKSQVDVPIQF